MPTAVPHPPNHNLESPRLVQSRHAATASPPRGKAERDTGGPSVTHERPTETAERLAFYEAIEPEGLTALWSVLGDIVTPEPKSPCVPFLWRFDTVRSRLLEAAGFITAKEAVRRVLILENPGLRGQLPVRRGSSANPLALASCPAKRPRRRERVAGSAAAAGPTDCAR